VIFQSFPAGRGPGVICLRDVRALK
jgi:hypothetical protein